MGTNLHNGLMSTCQSGSSFRLPSQHFPKVSIGIPVEKTPKIGQATRKEDETVLAVKKIAPSSRGKIVKEDRGQRTAAILEEKEASAKENISPWTSTRSMYHEIPNAQTFLFRAKASLLQSDDGLHEKLDSIIYEKKREKSGNAERVEEIAFAAMQELHLLRKGNVEEPAKFREGRSEALRTKLWQALGTTSSQNKHTSSPLPVNENAKISKSEKYRDSQIHDVPKPRQDTDTIETDSENPDMTPKKASPNQTGRPFTRSLARKKDPGTLPKLQLQKSNAKKHLSSSRSELKHKSEKKNIFAFDEGEKQMESSMFATNGQLPASAQKKHEMKNARVEPRRISFPSRSVSRKRSQSNKSLQIKDREQPLPPPENGANRTKTVRDTRPIHSEVKGKTRQPLSSISGKFVHPKNHHLENTSNSTLRKSSEAQGLNSPPPERQFKGSQGQSLSMDGHSHEKVSSPTLAGKAKSVDHFHSPTFAVNATIATLERTLRVNGCRSPVLSKEKAPVRSSISPPNRRACSFKSDRNPESSDDTRDLQASPPGESPPIVKGNTAEKCFFSSKVQPLTSASLETDELIDKGFRKTGRWSSKNSGQKKSPFTLRHGKRIRNIDDIEGRKLDPSSVFPFNFSGTGEAVGSHGLLNHTPEDGLHRAITQLTVVLERFKAKIKSDTCKKSSEILSSVGESIRLQLQEVESLIQADTEKFMRHGKSKRKRLESTFLEQEEKLKAMQEKFKEEVNQQLLDCRRTLEELKAYEGELKGDVERQKAAHRKLILQLEESMEAQLAGAETSMAAVHKAARKRMEGLKHALRGWLTDEGALN